MLELEMKNWTCGSLYKFAFLKEYKINKFWESYNYFLLEQ